jgi:hypothetical protein
MDGETAEITCVKVGVWWLVRAFGVHSKGRRDFYENDLDSRSNADSRYR